jgi:hypothetical protein
MIKAKNNRVNALIVNLIYLKNANKIKFLFHARVNMFIFEQNYSKNETHPNNTGCFILGFLCR